MAAGTVGRAPLPLETVVFVKTNLDAGHSPRAIVKLAAASDITVSRTSVRNIKAGPRQAKAPSTSRLAAGETVCPPTRCDGCKGLITVQPCRLCASRAFFAELQSRSQASQAKAATDGRRGIRSHR